MKPTSYTRFVVAPEDYLEVLLHIEGAINRCKFHAVGLAALSSQLIRTLRDIDDPDLRDYAGLLLENVEAMEADSAAQRSALPTRQGWCV